MKDERTKTRTELLVLSFILSPLSFVYGGSFSTACCSSFFIYSEPVVVLPQQTLLMTQALRTSAAIMFRR